MARIRRQNCPPDRQPELWLKRLSAGESLTCVILSRAMWGIWTHFNGRESVGCFENECPHCTGAEKLPLRWKGALHVWIQATGKDVILELPEKSARALCELLPRDRPYRGCKVTFTRGNGPKARIAATFLSVSNAALVMVPEKDPWTVYRKLLKIPDGVHLGPSITVLSKAESA